MNKQIEEMAKEIENAKRDIWAGVTTREEDEDYLWHSRRIAENLINLGYQKVDKDKQVVLSKEKLNEIAKEMQSVEEEYLSYKKNAGEMQENIKFPERYRKQINEILLKVIGKETISADIFNVIHSNSAFNDT